MTRAEIARPDLTSDARTIKLTWFAAIFICAAYVAFLFSLSSFPFQDFPNHLARGTVMADLLFHHGAQFGRSFSLALVPIPYVAHDLIFTLSIELFGIKAGSAVFASMVFLSLPLALLFYMQVLQLAPRAKVFVFLISLYLATDQFFLMAFTAFRLALAAIIVTLALAEMLRRRWSRALFGVYVGALLFGYLIHLGAPVFFAVALGVSALVRLKFRTTTVRCEFSLLAPLATLLMFHFGVVAPAPVHVDAASNSFLWGTLQSKLYNLLFEFRRFGTRPAALMMILLAFCLLWPIRAALNRRSFAKLDVLEPLLIAGAFLVLYCLLPQEYSDAAYVDIRALALAMLMLLLACLNLSESGTAGRPYGELSAVALAALLAVGNLGYLIMHVGRNDVLLTNYRNVAAAIPHGAAVLPVYTQRMEGDLYPFLHAGSYIVTDRKAVMPYLFSENQGAPMKYFRYSKLPYMPNEEWYQAQLNWNAGVQQSYEVEGQRYTWRFTYSKRDNAWEMANLTVIDWNHVACDYDFLLVMMPAQMSMIGVPTKLVRANSAAALLAVDKSMCHPERLVKRKVQLRSEQ